MSWRPPDWNNPHTHEEKDYQDGVRIIVANPLHYEFEAGADAMLEALKELPTSVLLAAVYKKEAE